MNLKHLMALAISITTGSALAGPFVSNDTRSNAMGGAGVAAAEPASAANMNPALLGNYPDSERFNLIIPSVGGYIEDPEGILADMEDFSEDGLEDYENLDGEALTAAVNNLTDAATALSAASATLEGLDPTSASYATDLSTAYDDLSTAQSDMTSAIANVRTETSNLRSVVDTTKNTFSDFSGRPMQSGVLGGLGMALPGGNFKWGVVINQNAFTGAELSLAPADLAAADYALLSLEDYVDQVEIVNNSVGSTTDGSGVIGAADTLNNLDPDDFPNPIDFQNAVTAAQGDLTVASADLATEVATLDNFTSNTSSDYVAEGTYPSDYPEFTDPLVNAGTFDETVIDPETIYSEVQIVGVSVTEVGIATGQLFNFGGDDFTLGATFKLQQIIIFDKNIAYDDFEEDAEGELEQAIEENTISETTGNIDIGAAKSFNYKGSLTGGVVIKDIIPQTFKSKSGQDIDFNPKVRIGAAHTTAYTTLAADLDLTENQPIAIGVPTRYMSLGAELDIKNWLKLRTGYKNNLSVADSDTVSFGAGLTPWGVGIDLTIWFPPGANSETELAKGLGVMGQFSMRF